MSNNNVQNIITNCIAGLLTDADEARNYANDPSAYLADKLEGHDVAGVDMAAAVRQASVEADLPVDTAAAVNDAVYQPAATVRVQRPDKYDEDGDGRDDRYDEAPDEPTPPKGWEPEGIEEYEGYHPNPTDVLNVDDLPPMQDQRPTLDERPVNREYENEAPRYEEMDNGGYRAELPQDWDHTAYTPDNYGHDGPMDLDCVEYSVSNCVTTAYGDSPEIADAICEKRNWEDPYDRHDPSHDFADMAPVDPYAEQPYAEQDVDRPMDDADRYEAPVREEVRDEEPVRDDRHEEPVREEVRDDRHEEPVREEVRYEEPVRDDRYDADDMDRHDDMADEDCDELDEQRMPERADAEYDAPQAEADYGNEYDAPVVPTAEADYGQGYETPEVHEVEYQAPAEVHEVEYDEAPAYVEPEVVEEVPVYHEPDTYEAPVDDMANDMAMDMPADEVMVD